MFVLSPFFVTEIYFYYYFDIVAIFLNELVLAFQGILSIGYVNVPYANEALFYAGIHPITPANQLLLTDYQRLHHHICRILSIAIERGGTTLRDFVNSKGDPGYFQQELMVYGREAKNCLICQHVLELVRVNNRSTIYCPQCQPAFRSF